MAKPISLSITGSRDISPESVIFIQQKMAEYVKDPYINTIYFGGALGSDTEALRAALNSRVGPRPKLVVVVPQMLHNQPMSTRPISAQADEIIELGLDDINIMYKLRNEYLVAYANKVAAFWTGNQKLGTAQTIRIAEAAGKPVDKWIIT